VMRLIWINKQNRIKINEIFSKDSIRIIRLHGCCGIV
jgi:hypothetical protein